MLTQEQNDLLTRVGAGTPMGELMRRYWHPIAAVSEMESEPTREVRLLGEDLVLYKDRSGNYGLIDRYCAHRRVNLAYGIPEEQGLRCMYHGWMYDETGQCIEQPFEETVRPESRFKDKIKLSGYPVQELGGLLFAYLGPAPAPLLPRWEFLTLEHNVLRETFVTELPCNWLQCQENSLDPLHLEWLHGYYGAYMAEVKGNTAEAAAAYDVVARGRHKKIGFDPFEYGIIKRRTWGDYDEESDFWKVGHPILFPNILHQGNPGRYFLQFRTPIDDTHTMHLEYTIYIMPAWVDMPQQDTKDIPVNYWPLYEENGKFRSETILDQDQNVWVTQGPIMDRTKEKLGESDVGIIMFRKMLEEQARIVEDGGEPMNVFRDPEQNQCIRAPQEFMTHIQLDTDLDITARYDSQLRGHIAEWLEKAKETAPKLG
jgi:5,5'-dehydrodivanillate O-demethylase